MGAADLTSRNGNDNCAPKSDYGAATPRQQTNRNRGSRSAITPDCLSETEERGRERGELGGERETGL